MDRTSSDRISFSMFFSIPLNGNIGTNAIPPPSPGKGRVGEEGEGGKAGFSMFEFSQAKFSQIPEYLNSLVKNCKWLIRTVLNSGLYHTRELEC